VLSNRTWGNGIQPLLGTVLFLFSPFPHHNPVNHSHVNCPNSTIILQAPRFISAPRIPKRSNAIRHLERNDYFQATVSVRAYVDRLETSSRIENVTSGEGSDAFGCRRRFTVRCESLYCVPHRTVSASTGGESGTVTDHAPRLIPLLAVSDRKRESRVWKGERSRS
jgi:hypothetical protein